MKKNIFIFEYQGQKFNILTVIAKTLLLLICVGIIVLELILLAI